MKHLIATVFFISGFTFAVLAQYAAVSYDLQKNWFNEGQPVPAEKALIFNGVLPEGIAMAEISILSSNGKNVLYKASGNKQANNAFSIPVSYKLKSSDRYDFKIDFFGKVNEARKKRLTKQLNESLETYIDVNLAGKKSIKLLKKSSKSVREMNNLILSALADYRTKTAAPKFELSDLVRMKLEQLDKADLDNGYHKKENAPSRQEVRNATRKQLVGELKTRINQEVDQMLLPELLFLRESHTVDNYETEKKNKGLAINAGYGAVYLSGDLQDFTYGASPYFGLAFPLGNSVLGSKFLGNTSLTLGFFLNNFEDEKENKVTGFIVDRPIYLGLDHKLFKFIRVNAGATFLEGIKTDIVNAPDDSSPTKIMIRPFVGLSARVDLSIGLGK